MINSFEELKIYCYAFPACKWLDIIIVNNFKKTSTSVVAYRNDGRYCIGNSIAKRSIHMTIERNKIIFGSHKGAKYLKTKT